MLSVAAGLQANKSDHLRMRSRHGDLKNLRHQEIRHHKMFWKTYFILPLQVGLDRTSTVLAYHIHVAFLSLTDSLAPTWRIFNCAKETKNMITNRKCPDFSLLREFHIHIKHNVIITSQLLTRVHFSSKYAIKILLNNLYLTFRPTCESAEVSLSEHFF